MSNDGWDDWGTDTTNAAQASSDSDWNNWDAPTDTQTNNTEADTGWDSWDSSASTTTNTNSTGADTDWDSWDSPASTATNMDDWGSADTTNNNEADINSYWDNQASNNTANTTNKTTSHISNLSSKKIAVIVLAGGIALALILLFVSKIHITKKTANVPNTNVVTTNTSTDTSAGLKLIELNGISNTGNIQAIDGTVHNKLYYAVETGTGYSIVCLIQIKVISGSNVEIWDYFCSQQAYNAVAIGDNLLVSYSIPSSGKCLIHNVQKK